MNRLLYICSGNAAKLREFQLAGRIQAVPNVELLPLPGLASINSPPENGVAFEENAVLKALYYSRFTPEWVLADDSGLEVDALSGGPGIYSARFAGPAANDAANNKLLLRRLSGVDHRRARFTCAIALAKEGKPIKTFQASVEGMILEAGQGESGFGYDPLFFHQPFARSFGQLTPEEKLSVSHRGQAIRQLFAWLAHEAPGS